MGRRRNGAADFFQGFGSAYDTVGKVAEDFQLANIAGQQPDWIPEASGQEALQAGLDSLRQAQTANPEQADQIARDYAPTIAGLERIQTKPAGEHYSLGTGANFTQFDHAPSSAEQMPIKSNQMADVIQARDPIRAQQLRHAAMTNMQLGQEQQDRDAIRSAWRGSGDPSTTTAPVGLQRIDVDAGGATPVPASGPRPSATEGATGTSADLPIPAQPMAAGDAGALPVAGGAQPAIGAHAVAADAALSKAATRESANTYYQRKAPQIIDTYLKQGKVKEAKDFRDFIDSEDGRAYTHAWARGVRQLTAGDDHGAIQTFQDMYNSQAYPDGRTVRLTPLEGGKSYQAQFIGPDGQAMHSVTKPTSEFVRMAGMALAPEKMAEFTATQLGKREAEAATLDRQEYLERMRQQGQETRDDRRDERLQTRLDASDRMLSRRLDAYSDRGLTTTQQRTNDAIDATRTQLTGMSQAEVLRKTQSTTATGRPNPDYDPQMARAVKLANTRKFGEDPEHDAFSTGRAQQQQSAQGAAAIQQKFSADPAMRGMRLGRQTANGAEVFDSSGKHIGFYR